MFSGPVDLGRWTPSASELAEANGLSEVSAKKGLSLAISVGWVTRRGRSLVLAWESPGNFGNLARIPEDPPKDPRVAEGSSRIRILEDPSADPLVTSLGSSGNQPRILEDPSLLTTPLPQATQLPQTRETSISGEQFALIPQVPERDAITDAKIRVWWTEIFVPLRASTLDAYRPGVAQPIACSPSRLKAIRARIVETCPDETWTEQRERLTHVVRNAAARVHEHAGAETSWGWSSLDAIQPKHWTAEKNFTRYYEAPPSDPSAGKQAVEVEVIGGVVQYPRADDTDYGTGTAYGDPARRRR
jgi:hypothetical protein